MTQLLAMVNAMLIALNGFLAAGQLDGTLDATTKAILAVVIGVALAGLGTILPAVSAAVRRGLDLQRRGN